MDWLLILYAIVAIGANLLAALMLLQAYEHVRFFGSRRRKSCSANYTPRLELFVPCKGIDAGFDTMVEKTLTQDYPAYGVVFVVESANDPAHARLHEMLPRFPSVQTQIVIAGQASDCGQKVHNLLAATAHVDPATEALAFMDSDIRPEADWLRRLVSRLRKKEVGAVTGYRWFMPKTKSWPGAILSALNGVFAFALGNHRRNVLWGGSWAIRRQTFEEAGIRQAWQGVLSDDYAVWRAVRQTGLHISFEPSCLLASPVHYTWSSVFEFVRRQYLITRIYAPGLWWLALFAETFFCTAFWGGPLLCSYCLSLGQPAWWPVLATVLLYGLVAGRALIRQKVAASQFGDWHDALRRPRLLDIWARPLLGLANLGLLLSSAFGRRITWRGIQYQLDAPNRIRILSFPASDGRRSAA